LKTSTFVDSKPIMVLNFGPILTFIIMTPLVIGVIRIDNYMIVIILIQIGKIILLKMC
jgi:hypothetical protein